MMIPSSLAPTRRAGLQRVHRLLFASCLLVLSSSAVTAELTEAEKEREAAKPWITKTIVVNGQSLYISPATVITFLFLVLNLVRACMPENHWAEASHILIKDDSDKAKAMLTEMKKDIGSDLKKFSEMAAKYSQCPSKSRGGDLGRFRPGNMVPPFDRAVFSKDTKIGTTLGPVQTNFGYHLIYVRERKMS